MKNNHYLGKRKTAIPIIVLINFYKRVSNISQIKFAFLLFIGVTISFRSMACDPTDSLTPSDPINNSDGTYDLAFEVCIGDAGSITGIPISVTDANIIGFSPTTLTSTNTATGSISNGILTYSYPSGTATTNMFVAPNTGPCFDITITLDQFPGGSTLTVNNTNDNYTNSCNSNGFDDFISTTIPFFEYSCYDGPIYDPGGATANYFNDEDIRYLICPGIAGNAITLDFASFDLEDGNDSLYIYDENGISTTPTSFTGTNSPGTISATNSTGCLTLVFTSDGSGTAPGFEYSISCPTFCGASFTDPNGPNSNYGNNADVTYNICNDIYGFPITINFTAFNLEQDYDFMYIYDADSATGTPNTYTNTNSPGSVTATNPSGCLTVVFQSDGSVTRPGWESTISCGCDSGATVTGSTSVTTAVCPDMGTNGIAEANGSGGTPPYNYIWEDGSTTQSVSLAAGTYSVTIYDSDYCYDITSVTMYDDISPIAICQDISVQLDATGNASITAAQIDNGSYDECQGRAVTLSADITSFDCSDIGANAVVLTVNVDGYIATCTSTVTVMDNIVPIANCQNISIQLDAAGNASITAADIDNSSSDNCNMQYSIDINNFDCTNLGDNTVTLTVVDSGGNTATCTSIVTVIAEIEILGNSIVIPNGDITPDFADGTNMGSALIGDAVTQTFTINNTNNNLILNLSNANITGDSEFTLGSVPSVVPAGGSITFDITYTPAVVGSNTAIFSVMDDCSGTYTFSISADASDIPAEALNFDGNNDYCFANINSPTDFTMEAWVKVDPTGNGYRAFLVWQKTGPSHETSLEVNGAGLVRFGQYDYGNSRWEQVFSTTNIKDGTCHHVAGVVSGNQRLLYIDGVLEGTLTVNTNNNAAKNLTDLRIGNIQLFNGNLREHFKGDIDEVRIWDYARSCQEIINDMGCELAGSESGLMAYYDFNQGVASGNNPNETVLLDRTANGYDATLNNFALTTGSVSNWVEPGCGAPLATCIPFLGTIAVFGNGQNIPNNDNSPETADGTAYGTIDFGTSNTHTFVIGNLGAADLTISNITLSGTGASSFSIDNSLSYPITIPSLGTQSIDITFLDNTCISGLSLATVSIENDDCNDNPYEFDIQGTKSDLSAPSISCKDITLSPDANGNITVLSSDIDDGTTDNCSFSLSVSPSTFTCSNTGSNTVTLTATDSSGNSSSCTSTVTITSVAVGFVR